MKQKILSLLREHKHREAFWAAAENVTTGTDKSPHLTGRETIITIFETITCKQGNL